MKNFLTGVSVTLGLVAVAMFISRSPDKMPTPYVVPTPLVVPTVVAKPTPEPTFAVGAEYRQVFIDGCLEDDPTQIGFCNCAADYLYDHYSLNAVAVAGLQYEQDGTLHQMFYEALAECTDETN